MQHSGKNDEQLVQNDESERNKCRRARQCDRNTGLLLFLAMFNNWLRLATCHHHLQEFSKSMQPVKRRS